MLYYYIFFEVSNFYSKFISLSIYLNLHETTKKNVQGSHNPKSWRDYKNLYMLHVASSQVTKAWIGGVNLVRNHKQLKESSVSKWPTLSRLSCTALCSRVIDCVIEEALA